MPIGHNLNVLIFKVLNGIEANNMVFGPGNNGVDSQLGAH